MTNTTPKNTTIPTYNQYKDTRIPWLGQIPAHWEVVKMKWIFNEISIKNRPYEELLSVTQTKGVVPRKLVKNRMVMPSGNLESFKYIDKDNFAISLRSFEGGLEYSAYKGIISPAYTVLKLMKNSVTIRNYRSSKDVFHFISGRERYKMDR